MSLKLIFNPFSGTLDWVDIVDASAFAAPVPTFIAAADTWTIPIHTQALYAATIDAEGTIDAPGLLIEVS